MPHVVPGIEDLVVIGHGGAGVVYRGRQPDLGRDVAVKVVRSGGTAEADLARWRREIGAMARLSNHPNIVAVYDGGTTAEGLPYLVMPYVPGGTLGDRLRSEGALPPDEVVAMGRRLSGALAAAHAAGVLHRDIKPDNVLLSPYGEPQLADFGIARLLDATATATRRIHATVAYAAPEVLDGQPASEASDVYGLGATLYACLSGSAPFAAHDDEPWIALAVRVHREAPPDLRGRGVPADVAAVIEHSMAKDPRARIPTAEDLGRRLDALDAGRGSSAATSSSEPVPTSATPVTSPAPTPPLAPTPTSGPTSARRRGQGPVVLGLVAVGVVAGLAWVSLQDDSEGDGASGGTETTAAPADTSSSAPPVADVGSAAVAYLDALDRGDLEAAYAMTSAGFQAAQPFDGYVEFWGAFGTIAIEGEPIIDDDDLIATLDLRLDGSRERYTLSFVRADDGTLLIDGPRPR